MTRAPLAELARSVGLALDWEDIDGVPRRVSPDAARAILTALGHPCDHERACLDSLAALRSRPPTGLIVAETGRSFTLRTQRRAARLVLESGETRNLVLTSAPDGAASTTIAEIGYHRIETNDAAFDVAVCPPRCVTVGDRLGRRAWGLAAQVYSLPGSGPFGDFGDLARLARTAGQAGADALAVSPVHALFAADPTAYSPYSPSSRDHLNGLFVSLADLGVHLPPTAPERLIDWPRVSPAKHSALRQALAGLTKDPRRRAFVEVGGTSLRRYALFEALHHRFKENHGLADWRDWPAAFRRPQTAEAAIDEDLAADVEFHMGLQWAADQGLERAQASALHAGMGLGLISDLAVGLAPNGAHAWAFPEDLLTGLTLGAPPDAFQAKGQGWGITSFAPAALDRQGFAPFLRTLRSALKHAGGVRIDHALGLKRLWVLPEGASPLEGAYLDAPFKSLLGLLALESHRANAIIVGEDLGVVPDGLRETLEDHGVLGMQVLPFEQVAGRPRPPAAWRRRAVALTSTHDLAPIGGWWSGGDLSWRRKLEPEFDLDAAQAERANARRDLWSAAQAAGLAGDAQPPPNAPGSAVDAAIAYVASTPCELVLLPLEDLFAEIEAVNLPGVVDEHPNWRRRYRQEVSAMFDRPEVAQRLERLRKERPR